MIIDILKDLIGIEIDSSTLCLNMKWSLVLVVGFINTCVWKKAFFTKKRK